MVVGRVSNVFPRPSSIDEAISLLDSKLGEIAGMPHTEEEHALERELVAAHAKGVDPLLPSTVFLRVPKSASSVVYQSPSTINQAIDVPRGGRIERVYIRGEFEAGLNVEGALRRLHAEYGDIVLDHWEYLAMSLLLPSPHTWMTRIPGHVSVPLAQAWDGKGHVASGEGSREDVGWGGVGVVDARLWSRYWLAVRRLEEEIVARGFSVLEGFSAQSPRSQVGMMDLTRTLRGVKRVCEVGFNAGHSALTFLLARPDVQVLSFDLGEHGCAHAAASILHKWFPGRLRVVWGNSLKTIPDALGVGGWAWSEGGGCDLILVDGGHEFEEALADLTNLIDAVHLQAAQTTSSTSLPEVPVLLDDGYSQLAHFSGVTRAFFRLIESGKLSRHGNHIPITRIDTVSPFVYSPSVASPSIRTTTSTLVSDRLATPSDPNPRFLDAGFFPTPPSTNYKTTQAAILVAHTIPPLSPPTKNPAQAAVELLLPHLNSSSSHPSFPPPTSFPSIDIDRFFQQHKPLATALLRDAIANRADSATIVALTRACAV